MVTNNNNVAMVTNNNNANKEMDDLLEYLANNGGL